MVVSGFDDLSIARPLLKTFQESNFDFLVVCFEFGLDSVVSFEISILASFGRETLVAAILGSLAELSSTIVGLIFS